MSALSSPRQATLSETPRVVLIAGAVSTELTRSLVSLARPRLETALVSTEASGRPSGGRTCLTAWFRHDEHPVVGEVVTALCSLTGIESCLAEQLHVIRYAPGGQYRAHYDGYDLATAAGRRCTERRGQRTHTALLYLNAGFTGGETCFPRLGLEVTPVEGAALIFDNCKPGTAIRDGNSLHAGAPVLTGEKWLGTLWFRERPGGQGRPRRLRTGR
jgi:prolyl 4-hydroxylase